MDSCSPSATGLKPSVVSHSLPGPAGTQLQLPLAGTTALERYGSADPPGWPSPCQPYSWRPLQQPHSEWPAALLQRLAPKAGAGAPAVPTPDALALAGAPAVSPEAAFQVALKHEAEQAAAAAAAEPAEPPAETAPSGAATAAAAAAPTTTGAKRSRGRRRGRGQPAGEEDDADALEALPLESEATIEVEGHRVQRHIHIDGGAPWAVWGLGWVLPLSAAGRLSSAVGARFLPAFSASQHPPASCSLQTSRCWWAARRWRRCWAGRATRRSRPPSEGEGRFWFVVLFCVPLGVGCCGVASPNAAHPTPVAQEAGLLAAQVRRQRVQGQTGGSWPAPGGGPAAPPRA